LPSKTTPARGRQSSRCRRREPSPSQPARPRRCCAGRSHLHGQVSTRSATCMGCHGRNAKGTPWPWSPISPPLMALGRWQLCGDAKIIAEGVPQPKQYRLPMPTHGGSQLTSDQVSAVAGVHLGLEPPFSGTSGTSTTPTTTAIVPAELAHSVDLTARLTPPTATICKSFALRRAPDVWRFGRRKRVRPKGEFSTVFRFSTGAFSRSRHAAVR